MKFLLLVLILFPVFNLSAQKITSIHSNVDHKLLDLCFIDSLTGWIVGDNSTLLKTSDGGNTWINQEPPILGKSLRHVEFLDKNNGYILTYDQLLKTIDGGENWEILADDLDMFLENICFINENEGWISTTYVLEDEYTFSLRSSIHSTIDGGYSWKLIFENDYDSTHYPYIIEKIIFKDSDVGVAVGNVSDPFEPNTILRTIDGGNNWTERRKFSFAGRDIKIANEDTLWMSGKYFSYSTDFGETWSNVLLENKSINGDFALIAPKHGRKGWITYDTENGKYLTTYSDDSFSVWDGYVNILDFVPSKIDFLNNALWIIGTKGEILRNFETVTKVLPLSNEITNSFELLQNYPNPFNPNTVIRYNIPKSENYQSVSVRIIVYDLLGKLIETLVNKKHSPGNYEINFDASELSSGIYIYKIIAEDFIDSKKMILLR